VADPGEWVNERSWIARSPLMIEGDGMKAAVKIAAA